MLEPQPEPPAQRGLTELLDDLDEPEPPQAWALETESDAAPAAVIRSRPETDSSRFPRVDSSEPEAPTKFDKPLPPALTPPSNPVFEPDFSPPPEPRQPPAVEPRSRPELAAAADDPESAAAAAEAASDPLAGLRVRTRRPRTLLWVALISFTLAALGAVFYMQSDAFHPERDTTRAMIAEDEKERALAEHRRRQPEQGQLIVEASEPEAAVWLKLGRTPLRSLAVRSGQVHYVRYELEGHQPVDHVIARAHWVGAGGEQEARHEAQLSRGEKTLPSFPPEPAVRPAPGPPGEGPMVMTSSPAGAEVWLLIGITPDVKLTGVRAGRRYELKVLKEGYRPAFASIKESDWAMGEREVRARVKLSPLVSRRR